MERIRSSYNCMHCSTYVSEETRRLIPIDDKDLVCPECLKKSPRHMRLSWVNVKTDYTNTYLAFRKIISIADDSEILYSSIIRFLDSNNMYSANLTKGDIEKRFNKLPDEYWDKLNYMEMCIEASAEPSDVYNICEDINNETNLYRVTYENYFYYFLEYKDFYNDIRKVILLNMCNKNENIDSYVDIFIPRNDVYNTLYWRKGKNSMICVNTHEAFMNVVHEQKAIPSTVFNGILYDKFFTEHPEIDTETTWTQTTKFKYCKFNNFAVMFDYTGGNR